MQAATANAVLTGSKKNNGPVPQPGADKPKAEGPGVDSSGSTRFHLERPAGGTTNTPALGPPRPALEALRQTLPHPLRSRVESARELALRRRSSRGEPLLPTAEPAFDRLLGGGLARRSLVELVGRRSSGRFSLLLTVLAAVTGTGRAVAFVDLGDGLDPQAATLTGVDLARLLWLRPRRLKEALSAAETVLAGGFPLVVLDLGLPPLSGRADEGCWLRLARAARDHEAALLVSAPYRVSGTAAAAVFAVESARVAWLGDGAAPRLLAGVASHLAVTKQRGQAPGDHARLPWRAIPFLDPAAELAPPAAARPPEAEPLPLVAVGGGR